LRSRSTVVNSGLRSSSLPPAPLSSTATRSVDRSCIVRFLAEVTGEFGRRPEEGCEPFRHRFGTGWLRVGRRGAGTGEGQGDGAEAQARSLHDVSSLLATPQSTKTNSLALNSRRQALTSPCLVA